MQGYTQEKFAEMIDITPRNLNRIESGKNFVTAQTLDKILSALNVSPGILFSCKYLKEEDDDDNMLNQIYAFIDKIKFKPQQLEKTYQLIKILSENGNF